MTIEKDNKVLIKLPAQNYLHNQSDQNNLLFTKFSLKPGDEWAHIVHFLNFFEKKDESEYRKHEEKLLVNYQNKKMGLGENHENLIELDPSIVEFFHDFFEKHYLWYAGEYIMTVNIFSDRASANIIKKYRFTIFESDEMRLKTITDYFKFGGGIWWDPKIQTNIILEIKDI